MGGRGFPPRRPDFIMGKLKFYRTGKLIWAFCGKHVFGLRTAPALPPHKHGAKVLKQIGGISYHVEVEISFCELLNIAAYAYQDVHAWSAL